jgi:hypothetical protein
MNELVAASPLAGLAAAATRALTRFRAALSTALTRADGGAVEPHWADAMPERARRLAAMEDSGFRRSAVFDEWMIWRR